MNRPVGFRGKAHGRGLGMKTPEAKRITKIAFFYDNACLKENFAYRNLLCLVASHV